MWEPFPITWIKISKDKQVVIHCQTGDCSAVAYSLLAKNCFKNVKNFLGGMKEWLTSGGKTIAFKEASYVSD